MKRYRILGFDFDSRARLLDSIPEEWDEQTKALHRDNQARILQGLREEHGVRDFDEKHRNFIDLGVKPFSVVAFHNRFYEQARAAFVQCQYYPALTAVCALGERVLNHLVLGLRDHYKVSPHYKHVYRKESFDNWGVALDALHDWGVLTIRAETAFRELSRRRNEAIHFNIKTANNDRKDALEALLAFGQILESQFSAFGALPWLFNTPGEIYIRKDWEDNPFVRFVYLPNAVYVGFNHRVVSIFPWKVDDPEVYASEEVSDEEFSRLRAASQDTSSVSKEWK